MKKIWFSLVLILMFNANQVSGQGMSTFYFLTISPSPENSGLAGSYVSLKSDDPFAAWYNPAQLAFSGSINELKTAFYIQPMIVLPAYASYGPKLQSQAISFRGRIKESSYRYGVSLSNVLLYSEENATDELGKVFWKGYSYDNATSLSVAFGNDAFIPWSVGYTLKSVRAKWPNIGIISSSDPHKVEFVNPNNFANDFGAQVKFPVFKLFGNKFENATEIKGFKPFFDLSLGYALSNVGNEVDFGSGST